MNAYLIHLPWQLARWPEVSSATDGTIIYPGQGSLLVYSDKSNLGSLKDFAWSLSSNDHDLSAVELPGPAVRGPEREKLLIRTGDALTLQFEPNSLPQWRQDYHDTLPDAHKQYDDFIDDLLTRMLEIEDFANTLQKHSRSGHAYWSALLDRIIPFKDKDKAKRGLIVNLASKMSEYLRDIAFGPKRVLRRLRENTRLDRMQEVDTHCLIDYARRPGRTAAEKAGQKQKLLSVQRYESLNTLENRVVLDFCRRSLLECQRYKDQHSRLDPDKSRRLKKVTNYAKFCMAFREDVVWQDVIALTEPCRSPNYVLAQNPLYVEVWREYLNLLRQANLREALWRWPRRAWADLLRLLFNEVSRQLFTGKQRLSSRPIRLSKAFAGASWFRLASFDAGWHAESKGLFYLVDRTEITAFTSSKFMAMCNADFYLAWLKDGVSFWQLMPVWAMIGDMRWKDNQLADHLRLEWIKDLQNSLKALKVPAGIQIAGGIIIRADWMSAKTSLIREPDQEQWPIWFIETHARGQWVKDDLDVLFKPFRRLMAL